MEIKQLSCRRRRIQRAIIAVLLETFVNREYYNLMEVLGGGLEGNYINNQNILSNQTKHKTRKANNKYLNTRRGG